ncbi:uncharacterized protein LOC141602650 [Silene latifolia]|uniref:uncharacterized protein LOC141602650 n=1 Tax=Silene latifolia TaxID=37657 RepID=UPI003D779DA5
MTCSQHQKVTIMILKVDLQCRQCYKKVKKILRKFPEIRDQIFDEKQNTVIITVVCCSPERIMHKLCSKGRKTIKSIEIKEPNPKPKQAAPEPEKPKPKPDPQPQAKPPPAPVPVEKPQMNKPAPAPVVQWIPAGYPPHQIYPVSVCCGSCYEGRPGGPCNQYGRPAFYGNRCDYFTEENPSACSIM